MVSVGRHGVSAAVWPIPCQDGKMPDEEMAAEREFNERNIEEFRRNGGKVGGEFEGFPLLLLTSTGAKSSAERLNLIGYFDIDGKIYVVGSAAGRDEIPGGCSTFAPIPTSRSRSARIRPGPASPTNSRATNATASTPS